MEYNLLIQVLVCLSEETQVRKYVIRRFIQLIPVLIGITFLSFAMMRIAGSDAITEMYGSKGGVDQAIIDGASHLAARNMARGAEGAHCTPVP